MAVGSTLDAAVARSVGVAVDKAVGMIVNDMQAYTDGAEADLLKQIQELRAGKGLASHAGDADPLVRMPQGAVETGPDGHRSSTITRGTGLGASAPTSLLRQEVSPNYHAPIRHSLVCCKGRGRVARHPRRAMENRLRLIFLGSMARTQKCGKLGVSTTLKCSTLIRIYG